jgi:hypothetical protein
MRNRETHFEQVPIEVVEAILRQAAALAAILERSPAPASGLERPALAESLKPRAKYPSKGQL